MNKKPQVRKRILHSNTIFSINFKFKVKKLTLAFHHRCHSNIQSIGKLDKPVNIDDYSKTFVKIFERIEIAINSHFKLMRA